MRKVFTILFFWFVIKSCNLKIVKFLAMMSIRLFLFLIICSICKQCFGQDNYCTMNSFSQDYRDYMIRTSHYVADFNHFSGRDLQRDVALNIVLVVYENGPIVTPQMVQQKVNEVNIIFSPINLHFSICNIQYVDYPEHLAIPTGIQTWNPAIEQYVTDQAWLPGFLNIYYALGGGPNATLPIYGNADRILMNYGPTTVFAHEIGHYFSLLHTHAFDGYSTNISTLELVDGSNCSTQGDFICDTPADPGLYGRLAPYPVCAYIDSVSVDANGELYAPDINNYMCATYPNCITQFTQQQFERMSYCLGHERAYLKSGSLSFTVDSIPRKVCINNEPIALIGSNPQGMFSGPGVIENVFYPSAAGIGNHLILYVVNSNEEMLETTDNYVAFSDTVYSQTSSWQSFTATVSGDLSAFAFSMLHLNNQTFNYTIYEGSGISGIILSQGVINASSNFNLDWFKFNFSNAIQVIAGNQYTVRIDADSLYDIGGMKVNAYPLGESSEDHDLSFIQYVIPLIPNCGNSISFPISVGGITQTQVEVLFPEYCIDSPESEIIFSPSGGLGFIDGINGLTVNPSILGAGTHSVNYAYTNEFGCINSFSQNFVVNPPSTININDGSTFCSDNSILPIIVSPENGALLLDGNVITENELDLGLLTYGPHLLTYVKQNSYPWLETLNQQWSPINQFSAYAIPNNSTIWQSFKPSDDGFINHFNFGLYSNDVTQVEYKLFKGTGDTGDQLYTNMASFGAQSLYLQRFDFPFLEILLNKDSVYTFAVVFTNSNSSTANASSQSAYPRGTSNYSNQSLDVDIRFEFIINPLLNCSADSVTSQFFLVDDFTVDLGEDIFASIGQIITLDAGNAGNNYFWSTGDTTQIIQFEFDGSSEPVWVNVFNNAGCLSSDSINIQFVTDLKNVQFNKPQIDIYPNPVDEFLEIRASQKIDALRIINTLGQTVDFINQNKANQTQLTYAISHLNAGLYFIELYIDNNVFFEKIIKQ